MSATSAVSGQDTDSGSSTSATWDLSEGGEWSEAGSSWSDVDNEVPEVVLRVQDGPHAFVGRSGGTFLPFYSLQAKASALPCSLELTCNRTVPSSWPTL